MSATYTIYTSPDHPPVPDHLPTLIVTPHGKPQQILYTYLHTNYNRENYLLTPSPQGDLCVAKLFPPPTAPLRPSGGKSVSENGHGGAPGSSLRTVKCEASRNFKWSITNSGVLTPTYKCTLPADDTPGGMADEQPLFQISKTNPQSPFWTLWYYAYAGHLIPPKRIQFGHISKSITPDGKPITGGGTRVTITGKSDEEKAVWKTLGEGNEDMVEWAVICAALHALDDEIVKAAEAAGIRIGVMPGSTQKGPGHSSTPPMPNNMQRPQLHPTGQPVLKGPADGAPHSQAPPQGVMPSVRGPPLQQNGGLPGSDPRMRDPRMQQQQAPSPGQSQRGPPPGSYGGSPLQQIQPPQQEQGQRPGPPMQMPMPAIHQGQQQPPSQQQQQHPNAERRRLLSNNRPRPQQQPPPGAFSPQPNPHQQQQMFSPPIQQQSMSPEPQQYQQNPSRMMSPPINARPPPLAQQSNGHHIQPGFIPPQYQNGQPGPSSSHRMSPPNGQLRMPGGGPGPGPGPGPGQIPLSALRGARSPLPVPGSSNGPLPRRASPPSALQPSGGGYSAPPRNGSMRPPSDPAQYSRSPQPPFVQMNPPESPRRDRFPTAPPPQQHHQRSPQKQYAPPPQQQQQRELQEEDTVDSVAFMLGTTGLNDAAAGDDEDEAISPRYRGPVSSTGNNGRDPGSRVNRLLKSRS